MTATEYLILSSIMPNGALIMAAVITFLTRDRRKHRGAGGGIHPGE